MHTSRIATAIAAAVGFFVLSSSFAFAQPGAAPPPNTPARTYPGYYPGPPPPPPVYRPNRTHRRGLIIGFGFGVGDMAGEDGPIECANCEYDPFAGAIDFHIGGMINPRLAVMLEASLAGKSLDEAGDVTLMQYMGFAAVQLWVTQRLWIKGGIGWAGMTQTFDNGFEVREDEIGDGGALMGALGVEIVSGRRFALDLQLRLANVQLAREGSEYNGVFGDAVQTGLLSLGFNWYQ
ncbi:MAG: hypothetical protein MJE77_30605 [Proteobacteria bacterium]|nr:hypothetical protein [Pseudomonadota bacterium]